MTRMATNRSFILKWQKPSADGTFHGKSDQVRWKKVKQRTVNIHMVSSLLNWIYIFRILSPLICSNLSTLITFMIILNVLSDSKCENLFHWEKPKPKLEFILDWLKSWNPSKSTILWLAIVEIVFCSFHVWSPQID